MSLEDHQTDCKSLRTVSGKTADWAALAQDAVCFANGAGGRLLIGIEDGQALPPADQRIEPELLDRLRKRIGELSVNVQALPRLQCAANGGEFIELLIDRSPGVASTRDGRYFLRVGDSCQPVLGDDVLRLANERPGRPWEAMDSAVLRHAVDADKLANFVAGIRASSRVKDSVKEKGEDELLTHYGLAQGQTLTRLGVLLLGTQADRRALGVLAQTEGLTARELSVALAAEGVDELVVWLGQLLRSGLVQTQGKTSGMRYFVAPDWLRVVQLDRKTTLSRIAPHRLQALILEDLARYPESSTADVNRRIGVEISAKTVKRALDDLAAAGQVSHAGERRWRRYRLSAQAHQGQMAGSFSDVSDS